MSRSGSPKGVVQDAWKPKHFVVSGNLPKFDISLHDMILELNKSTVIKIIADEKLCRECGKAPRHKTATRTITKCKKCYHIYNKTKHGAIK